MLEHVSEPAAAAELRAGWETAARSSPAAAAAARQAMNTQAPPFPASCLHSRMFFTLGAVEGGVGFRALSSAAMGSGVVTVRASIAVSLQGYCCMARRPRACLVGAAVCAA